jgi:hypothetical protein
MEEAGGIKELASSQEGIRSYLTQEITVIFQSFKDTTLLGLS